MNICYVQARGGSKRFPGKNIALWNGEPMVANAIKKAKAIKLFDLVAVTSDDKRILDIAVQYGALPVYRSEKTANDSADDDDVFKEFIAPFNTRGVDIVCKLYPCIPLITVDDISKCIEATFLNWSGAYLTYADGVDAGACYVFTELQYSRYGSIALDKFPWVRIPTSNACDINTVEDLERAKKMAGI